MTATWIPSRKEYQTAVGTVTRSLWLDTTSLADSPRVKVTVVDGRGLVDIEMRVLKKGAKYRTEWLDGSPIRIFDGSRNWNFFYHPSDYAYEPGPIVPVESSDPDNSPFFYELPPQPVEDAAQGLDALSTTTIIYQGRPVIEVVRPVSDDRPHERGYRYLFDPDTGFLIRASYGDDEAPRSSNGVTCGSTSTSTMTSLLGPGPPDPNQQAKFEIVADPQSIHATV